MAATYLPIGAFFAKIDKSLPINVCISFILLGLFMMHFEQLHHDVALGVPVIAIGLFPLITKGSSYICIKNLNYLWLRKMSSMVYFVHMIILFFVSKMISPSTLAGWFSSVVACVAVAYFFEANGFKVFPLDENFELRRYDNNNYTLL